MSRMSRAAGPLANIWANVNVGLYIYIYTDCLIPPSDNRLEGTIPSVHEISFHYSYISRTFQGSLFRRLKLSGKEKGNFSSKRKKRGESGKAA